MDARYLVKHTLKWDQGSLEPGSVGGRGINHGEW